ncbi:MAG: hypothetical protein RLN75_09380, partial [Longimicrobiales bacterium]
VDRLGRPPAPETPDSRCPPPGGAIRASHDREEPMGIPHEPASIFVYVLLAVSGWGIWKGSRSGSSSATNDAGDDGRTVEP